MITLEGVILCSNVHDETKIRAYDILEEVVNMDARMKDERVIIFAAALCGLIIYTVKSLFRKKDFVPPSGSMELDIVW